MNTKRIAALILAAVMTLLFTACGSKTVINDDGTKTEQKESGVKVTQQKESGVKVTQTAAKAVQTEKYESADFSMTIPKGWTVTTGGTNIYHSIRVSDPNEPLNQMFFCTVRRAKTHGSKTTVWVIHRRHFFQKRLYLKIPQPKAFSKFFRSIRRLHRRLSPVIPDIPSRNSATLR